MEQRILASVSQDRVRLRHMPMAANVSFALGVIIICVPFLPVTPGGRSHPVWPDAPQNPWSSIYVGLTTLSKGHSFHHHALNKFLAYPQQISIILSPFLPELQRNSLFSLGFPDADAFRVKIWKEFQVTNIYV